MRSTLPDRWDEKKAWLVCSVCRVQKAVGRAGHVRKAGNARGAGKARDARRAGQAGKARDARRAGQAGTGDSDDRIDATGDIENPGRKVNVCEMSGGLTGSGG